MPPSATPASMPPAPSRCGRTRRRRSVPSSSPAQSAISGGSSTGIAAAGAGAYAENRIATSVDAKVDRQRHDRRSAAPASAPPRATPRRSASSPARPRSRSRSAARPVVPSRSASRSQSTRSMLGSRPSVADTARHHHERWRHRAGHHRDDGAVRQHGFGEPISTTSPRPTTSSPTGSAMQRSVTAIVADFLAHGTSLVLDDSISMASRYTTRDGLQLLDRGDLVRDVATGRAYRFLGADGTSVTSRPRRSPAPTGSASYRSGSRQLVPGLAWTLVDGSGTVYDLRLDLLSGKSSHRAPRSLSSPPLPASR